MTIAPELTQIFEGTRIPSAIPTVLEVPRELRETEDILEVNFGPNHPSTHGVLRLVIDLNGETVVGLRAVIGYLHTGFEKNMEQKTWWKAITYPERIDYLAFQNNELVFVLAIEKLLGIEVPRKATWMRMLLCELNRIHSHLVWLGTAGLELGAISMFWYCFRERDRILDLFEMVGGTRMHTRYFQAGGLAEDVPPGFWDECAKSVRIIDQALQRMPDGPWIADDRKVVLPPREELHTSMESLIHHFKIVTEGYRVPEGEVYVAVESARGELGCYVVSDGGPRPWRVEFRAPSFAALEATATTGQGSYIADLIAIVGSLDTLMGEVDR